MKKQVEQPEARTALLETITPSVDFLLDGLIGTGATEYDRVGTESEFREHLVNTSLCAIELHKAEEKLAELTALVKNLRIEHEGLVSVVRTDDEGNDYILIPEKIEGVWVSNKAFHELIAPTYDYAKAQGLVVAARRSSLVNNYSN